MALRDGDFGLVCAEAEWHKTKGSSCDLAPARVDSSCRARLRGPDLEGGDSRPLPPTLTVSQPSPLPSKGAPPLPCAPLPASPRPRGFVLHGPLPASPHPPCF